MNELIAEYQANLNMISFRKIVGYLATHPTAVFDITNEQYELIIKLRHEHKLTGWQ